jgi:hypothetical protein
MYKFKTMYEILKGIRHYIARLVTKTNQKFKLVKSSWKAIHFKIKKDIELNN